MSAQGGMPPGSPTEDEPVDWGVLMEELSSEQQEEIQKVRVTMLVNLVAY